MTANFAMNTKIRLRNNPLYDVCIALREWIEWRKRQYAAPSPRAIKQACLLRNGFAAATWVETGTFLGQTTRFLSKHAQKVYSIEPEPALFAAARQRLRNYSNVEILNGTSETVFPKLLPKISGDVNFWLDGHYSGGVTYKGAADTPVIDELRVIGENLDRFGRVCVLIDDIRCFSSTNPEYAAYPPVDALVGWARDHDMQWHIEHDIFVAMTRNA